MQYAKRKSNRLKNYDYSKNGAYFVTICSYDREKIFGEIVSDVFSDLDINGIVGEGFHALPNMCLSDIGKEIEKSINFINEKYLCVDKYVIMPNHVHLIIIFSESDRRGSLSLQEIVSRIKSYTTLKHNQIKCTKNLHLWQRSYHDHVIRDENDYQKIWQYIDTNILKWELDKYHIR